MRLAVVILVLLGMLAATAATMLVKFVGNREQTVKMVDVVVAQTDLPDRTKLDKTNIKLASLPAEGLPFGYYTNPSQAIGKLAKVKILEGQPLTSQMLAARGGIAEMLRPGMLAFSAPVSKRSTSVNLLEPGSIVDVQVTFPLRNRSNEGDAVVFTLLQQIRILALGSDKLGDQDQEPGVTRRVSSTSNSTGSSVVVTLEVSDRQARALGLALKHGTLALPLRNPTDHTFYPVEVMVLKEGRLTAGSRSLDPQDLMLFNQLTALLSGKWLVADANAPADVAFDPNDPNAPLPAAEPVMATRTLPTEAELGAVLLQKDSPKIKNVEIIRGQKVEEKELEVSDDETPADEGDGVAP